MNDIIKLVRDSQSKPTSKALQCSYKNMLLTQNIPMGKKGIRSVSHGLGVKLTILKFPKLGPQGVINRGRPSF